VGVSRSAVFEGAGAYYMFWSVPLHVGTIWDVHSGFVRVLENLESPGILLWHFPGLERPGKGLLVLESSGNMLNSSKKT